MHKALVLFIKQKQIAIGSFNPSDRIGFHRHLLLPHQNSGAGSELCTAKLEQPVAGGKQCLTASTSSLAPPRGCSPIASLVFRVISAQPLLLIDCLRDRINEYSLPSPSTATW